MNNTPLSEKSKYFIRVNYKNLSNNVDSGALLSALQQKKFFTNNDHVQLKDYDKGEILDYLLFHGLLTDGTYETLDVFKDCLKETNQADAIKYLDDSCEIKDTPEGATAASADNTNDSDEEIVVAAGGGSKSSGPKTKPQNESESDPVKPASGTGGQNVPDTRDGKMKEEDVEKANTFTRKVKRRVSKIFSIKKVPVKRKDENTRVSSAGDSNDLPDGRVVHDDYQLQQKQLNSRKPVLEMTDAFIHYDTKDPTSEYGNGMCVIFALFTADLRGYLRDMINLTNFFSNELQYDIMTFENLTKDELFSKITEVQQHIENNGTYDRLVFVVLTHGKADGLKTCADKDGTIEETEPGTNIAKITKMDDIVEKFKHNEIKCLKGMPKLFIVQACRGENMVRAAHIGAGHDDTAIPMYDNGQNLQFQPKSPVDGDIMICYGTTEDHPSLVNAHNGSWLIQKTIEVFKKHHRHEHVGDMLTVVNLAVAELRGKLLNQDGSYDLAVQMPCIFSTFRRRFYLVNKSPRR